MCNLKFIVSVVALTIMLCGCSSETATDNAIAAPASSPEPAIASHEASPSVDEVPTFETTPPLQLVPDFASAEACINAMQKAIDDSIVGSRKQPTLAGVAEAIQIGDEGRKQFPDSEQLLRAVIAVRYQSIPFEKNPATITSRQLELGDMARLLVERNSDNLAVLGNMPGFLLFGESKAHLAMSNVDKAFESLKEARSYGFEDARLFFLDSTFAPILKDETKLAEVLSWVDQDVDEMLATQSPFPFDFSLRSLTEDDATVGLKDFEGKVTLVDVWGTWCGPCRATIPHLIDLHSKYESDLQIVGINYEDPSGPIPYDETKASLKRFQVTEPLPYPCLYGTREVIAQIPGWRGFPTLVIVGKSGRVRFLGIGYQPAPILESVISKLAAE